MSMFFHGGAKGRQQFARDLGDALRGIGFAILTGHGVDASLYKETNQAVIDFFEQITPDERRPYLAQRSGSVNQGYFPIRETTIIHPDLVEGWVFCRRAFNMDKREGLIRANFGPR